MQQDNNHLLELESLIKLVNNNFINKTYFLDDAGKKRTEEIFNEAEDKRYDNMKLNVIMKDVEFLEAAFKDLPKNIFEDLKSDDLKTIAIERILYNLNLRLHTRIACWNYEDEFNKALFEGMQTQYFLISFIEENIRIIFEDLLRKHIDASSNMSDLYQTTLSKILKKITFKYHNNTKYSMDYFVTYINNHIETHQFTYFLNSYLDELIKVIINELLQYRDDELENDKVYAKTICYQLLLRSIFIIINDYERLITYENYYNNVEKKDTIAKSIIKTAFISNYNDLKEYSMKKSYGVVLNG